MKFTVHKSVFLNKLTPAMGTVSNKNTITSIEGVLLETMPDGTVRLSTYDLIKGFRCSFVPSSIEREGKYIINAQRLFQTVRVLPDDEITFDINDKLNCTVSSGKSSFSMFAMNGADFPNLPELTSERGFEVSADTLRMIIGKVSHSIGDSESRPMLCGAYFKISDEGMEVVSCDSYTLSRCNVKCDISSLSAKGELGYSFIIPGASLSELSKILGEGDEERVHFYLSRKHAIIKKGENVFFTKTIDSEYIDYNRMIPRENDISVTVERERILESLERAIIIADEKIKGSGRSYVKITAEGNYLVITSSSVNGKVFDEVDCVHEGGDIEIGFNCRYLINSIKVAEGDNIRITFKSATTAITIEPVEEDENYKYFYMILPVRMNDQK